MEDEAFEYFLEEEYQNNQIYYERMKSENKNPLEPNSEVDKNGLLRIRR